MLGSRLKSNKLISQSSVKILYLPSKADRVNIYYCNSNKAASFNLELIDRWLFSAGGRGRKQQLGLSVVKHIFNIKLQA